MIPKIIHQIWLGDKNKRPLDLMRTVIDRHSDWKYILWSEANIGDLINQKKYDQVFYLDNSGENKYPKLADIVRYEKLFNYGGIYIDADSRCNKPFDDLIDTQFFVAYENEGNRPGLIANGVIGSIPNHSILKECINEIGQLNKKTITRKPAFKITGTLLLTKIIQRSNNNYLETYPSRYFYPMHYSDSTTHLLDEDFQDCYTYQLWNSTVRNRRSLLKRASNKMYRIFNRNT